MTDKWQPTYGIRSAPRDLLGPKVLKATDFKCGLKADLRVLCLWTAVCLAAESAEVAACNV